VEEISRAFQRYKLDEYARILEVNKEVYIPLKTKSGARNLLIIEFFPFDPYLLRSSKVFVDGIYQNWDIPKHANAPSDEENNSNSFSYDESFVSSYGSLSKSNRNTMMLSSSFSEDVSSRDNQFSQTPEDDDSRYMREHEENAANGSDEGEDDDDEENEDEFCWADYAVSFSADYAQSPLK